MRVEVPTDLRIRRYIHNGILRRVIYLYNHRGRIYLSRGPRGPGRDNSCTVYAGILCIVYVYCILYIYIGTVDSDRGENFNLRKPAEYYYIISYCRSAGTAVSSSSSSRC